MISKKSFIGNWVSALPFDSDDYLVEYKISIKGGRFIVKATDLQDGEQMKISGIKYSSGILEFTSYMPSSKRRGVNKFRLIDENRMESEFTFTVIEELKRPEKKTGDSLTARKVRKNI
jgi:hypothetical protein